jgi:hypothetical protein
MPIQENRRSKFIEGSMNSRTSIHPPPSTFWQDLKIDNILDKANQPTTTITEVVSHTNGDDQEAINSQEGLFGRFSRVAASLFRRKKEPEPPKDTRKEQYEQAYMMAKKHGSLPQPKVFVRPSMRSSAVPGKPLSTPHMQWPL